MHPFRISMEIVYVCNCVKNREISTHKITYIQQRILKNCQFSFRLPIQNAHINLLSEIQQHSRQSQRFQPNELTPDQSGPQGNRIYAQQYQQQTVNQQQQQQQQWQQQQQQQTQQHIQFGDSVQQATQFIEVPKGDESLPWRRSKTPKIRSRSLQPLHDIEKLPWLRSHRDRSVPKQPTFLQMQRGRVPVRPWIEEVIKLKRTELHQKVIERAKLEKVQLKESQIEHKEIPHEELEKVDLKHLQWDADALKSGQITQLAEWQQALLADSGLTMHDIEHEDQMTILELTKQIDEIVHSDKSQGVPWEIQKKQLKTIERAQKVIDKFQVQDVDLKSMRQQTLQEHRKISAGQRLHTEDSNVMHVNQQSDIQMHRLDDQQRFMLQQQQQQPKMQPLSHTEDISVLKLSEHTQLDMRTIQQMEQETPHMWQRGGKQQKTDQGDLSYVEDSTILSLKKNEQITQKYTDLSETPVGWRRGPKPQETILSDSQVEMSQVEDEQTQPQEQALPWMRGKKIAKAAASHVEDTTVLKLNERQEITQQQLKSDEKPVMWQRGQKQHETTQHQEDEITQFVKPETEEEIKETPVAWERGKKVAKGTVPHVEDSTILKLDETQQPIQPEIIMDETPVMWRRGPKPQATQATEDTAEERVESLPKQLPPKEKPRPWTEEQVKLKKPQPKPVETEESIPREPTLQDKPRPWTEEQVNLKKLQPKPVETDETVQMRRDSIPKQPNDVKPWKEEQVKLKTARRESVEIEKLKPARDEVQLKPIKQTAPQQPAEIETVDEHKEGPAAQEPMPQQLEEEKPVPWRRGEKKKPVEKQPEEKQWPMGKRKPSTTDEVEKVELKPIPRKKPEEQKPKEQQELKPVKKDEIPVEQPTEVKETSLPQIRAGKAQIKAPKFIKKLKPEMCKPNEPTILAAIVEGTPFPEVKWFFNDAELRATENYEMNVVEKTVTLKIAKVTPELVGTYTCQVKNEAGVAISRANIALEKESGIAPIFTRPIEITYSEEENKILVSCQVEGTPKPNVVWKKNEQQIIPSETVQILYDESTGDIALILTEVPIEIDKPIVYKVEAENSFGKAISRAEVMQTVEQPEAVIPQVLKVPHVTPLEPQTIKNKATLTISSSYVGIPEPEIKWLKNGKEVVIDDDVTITIENGTSMLTVRNVDRKRAGKYEIVATNEIGESRASGSVMVSDDDAPEELMPPHFIQSLKPKTVLLDDVMILEASVKSHPGSSFQWFFNSTSITPTETMRIHSQNNRSVLYIDRFVAENDGVYTCRAENVAGSVTSSASIKLVESENQLEESNEYLSPRFIRKLKPVQLMDGEAMKLTCRVIGYPTPKISWFNNKRLLTPNKGIIIVQDSNGFCELNMPEVFVEDAGIYSCKAINKFGKSTTKTNVVIEAYEYVPDSEMTSQTIGSQEDLLDKTVSIEEDTLVAPKIVKKLPKVVKMKQGEATSLEVKAIGKPQPTPKWLKANEEIIPSDDYLIENYPDGTSVLTITNVQPDTIDQITFEAVSHVGIAKTATKLHIEEIVGTKEYRQPEWVTHMEEMREALKENIESDEAEKSLQTVKKKKIKTDKKHKRHQIDIDHTSETLDETITKSSIISEQSYIEHKVTSETHEQTIKSASLEVAPENTDTFVFDEKTLPMATDTGPKPIEILPIFHASNIQAASVIESETFIHLTDSPTQKCLVNISERTPLVISEIDETETVSTKEQEKTVPLHQLSSTLITSSAAISDQVIPSDNVNVFESKAMPATIVAESSRVLHESKTIFEQVATIKEDSLPNTYAPIPKQATKSISLQSSIEIQEVDAGESEKAILDKYEPAIQIATCSLISNTALSTQETLVENVSTKFYPETFIATEEAVPKYVEQIPYRTQEICTAEAENALDVQGMPTKKQAHLEFTNLQAIKIEQNDISESETVSTHTISADLLATAKDTFDLHKEMQTGFIQPIDSIVPREPMAFSTKRASLSVDEMDSKLVETVNVLHSEKPFDIIKPTMEQEASPSCVSQESVAVSETIVQESDSEFFPIALNLAKASKTHEVFKIAEQSDEQTLHATGDYHRKKVNETFNAQVNFELQKSVVREAIVTNDSEEAFETKLHTTLPHYSFDSKMNSPIVVSEVQTQEDSAQLSIEPTVQGEATTSQELYKTYEQQDEQVLDTTSEYRGDKKSVASNAQINFELQKSTIGKTVLAHDLEQIFDTKLKTNEPHYSFESNLKSPILVSENQIHESSIKFSTKPVVSTTAMTIQELCKAPESSENQTLESTNDFQRKDKLQESTAQINFELQTSMIRETIIAQESEKKFEKITHGIHPKYSLAPTINNSIVVSETQTIDSEKLLGTKPSETQQHLNIVDSPKHLSHVGSVSETILYDSPEIICTTLEQQVSAKEEHILHHEIKVEISTASETLDRLDQTKMRDEKKATASIMKKNALNVTVEESVESLDKLNVAVPKELVPNFKADMLPASSIVVDETKALEQTFSLDMDSLKTASAIVTTTLHNVAHIDENWPMEMLDDFKRSAIAAGQRPNQSIVESSAVETSTIISSDSLEEFEEKLEKPIQPKISLNEQNKLVIENIISQEMVEQSKFTLTQDVAQGHIVENVEEQRRCAYLQQNTFESTVPLQLKNVEQTVSITGNVSAALTTANVEEIQTISFGKTFEEMKPDQQHGKEVQETFNVIGQTVQNIPLESEENLTIDSKTKAEYPTKSIERMSFYATGAIELLEKEGEMVTKAQKISQVAKTTTEHSLAVASTSVDTALTNVHSQEATILEKPIRSAISTVERPFEGINREDILIHEMLSDVTIEKARTSVAKPTLEYKKSLQIEGIGPFDKEGKLERKETEEKICDQKLEDHLKSAVFEIVQPVEDIGKQPNYVMQTVKANELASEMNQSITFESVYLQEHTHSNESAQVINKVPTHAVKVIEQIPLYKDTNFEENKTEKLLIKPLVATQETTELKSAHKETEINTIVDIKTNKKAGKITNKRGTKKTIRKTEPSEAEDTPEEHTTPHTKPTYKSKQTEHIRKTEKIIQQLSLDDTQNIDNIQLVEELPESVIVLETENEEGLKKKTVVKKRVIKKQKGPKQEITEIQTVEKEDEAPVTTVTTSEIEAPFEVEPQDAEVVQELPETVIVLEGEDGSTKKTVIKKRVIKKKKGPKQEITEIQTVEKEDEAPVTTVTTSEIE
ncbi:titin-like, partial [Sitodiplosis mosellana]|uniref:titin-like n=1 Tax=Sitodiplosis mosellana TaxID=263140 RepID=UPI002443CE29